MTLLRHISKKLHPVGEQLPPMLMTGSNQGNSRKNDQWVAQLESVVEESLKHPNFTVEWLCQHLAISRRQLYRKIKALTGQTPKKFIQEKRLQRANELLRSNPKAKVREIAFAVGMKDVEYFSKQFRQRFGHLPSDINA